MPRGAQNRQSGQRAVLAAGGLLWNRSSEGLLLALVHRLTYGDWALPKGKLKRGETFEQAALREVREETGCVPRLRDFVGMVQYRAGSTPKVVLFWNMECARRPRPLATEEIADVIWLAPERALRRMSYASERAILRAFLRNCR